jgi:hypothetical protein
MFFDLPLLCGLGPLLDLIYSSFIDSSCTMTTAFGSFFTGLDCTPGKAFIDLTAGALRRPGKGVVSPDRQARKIRIDRASAPTQPLYAVTQPPPLNPLEVPAKQKQKIASEAAITTHQEFEQRLQNSIGIIGRDYPRIRDTIQAMWGHPECSPYIQNLILCGGDGMGNSRVGFKLGTVAALMLLDELHDTQFGKKFAEHVSVRRPRR